jgi:hypothetical protein
MTDPRSNIAHDKKVQHEKRHRHDEVTPGLDATPQLGKKTPMAHRAVHLRNMPDDAAEDA